ncbi:MAG: retropepsin-like domain-containing protein [Verrucomicrobiae bacterium]|nr:retropepsin-like domain-containing protein [Verrucomicrobiae bacterium]
MNTDRVVFRYKPMLGRLSPTATLGLCLNETWHRTDFYVDSGAAYSIVHGDFARDVGFEFTSGEGLWVKMGDGSLIPVFLHRVPLQIGPHRIEARIAFSDRLGIGFHLLGRLDVFDHFRVCFHGREQVVSFEPYPARE